MTTTENVAPASPSAPPTTDRIPVEAVPIGVQLWPTWKPEGAPNFTVDLVELIFRRDIQGCRRGRVIWHYSNGQTREFYEGEVIVVSFPPEVELAWEVVYDHGEGWQPIPCDLSRGRAAVDGDDYTTETAESFDEAFTLARENGPTGHGGASFVVRSVDGSWAVAY